MDGETNFDGGLWRVVYTLGGSMTEYRTGVIVPSLEAGLTGAGLDAIRSGLQTDHPGSEVRIKSVTREMDVRCYRPDDAGIADTTADTTEEHSRKQRGRRNG